MGKLDRFAPPGMTTRGIRFWTVGTIIVSTLFSTMFLTAYFEELNELKQMMEYPVYSGASMTDFESLVVSPMALFRIAPMVPLIFILMNYEYFYQGSKSVYIMKRLRNPFEMHIRCLVLPVLGALMVAAAGCAVYGFYWIVYRYCTPEILLPTYL